MKKVLVGGVFNVIHPGHEFFFNRAREYGDYLIVVVASNKTTLMTKKYAVLGENDRKKNIEKLKLADKVVVGHETDFMETVRIEMPDVIVLGYDQKISEKELSKQLSNENIKCKIVRIKDFLKGHKTSKLIKNKEKK
ncbi:MAG: adenylyltransferase/cytidyltransferase family protein [Candidatus Aenigmarchaeota archaeon]|nr:adenylyltransferase/cytidyltransferase family protein [Candidatus Aenigmarchaeota archaeon]